MTTFDEMIKEGAYCETAESAAAAYLEGVIGR